METESPGGGRLDPYVTKMLSQEPVDIQIGVVAIINIMKSIAKESACNIDFAEYARTKYPGTDEDTITIIKDILENPPEG